jgi:hypothetical protein
MVPVPAARPMWRSPWLLTAAVVVIAALAVWKLRFPMRPAGTTESGPMQISQLTTTGDIGQGGISPDGRLVAYERERRGEVSMWMLQLATGSTAQISDLGTSAVVGGPRFSPDGNYLYFSTQAFGNHTLTLYRVAWRHSRNCIGRCARHHLVFTGRKAICVHPGGPCETRELCVDGGAGWL